MRPELCHRFYKNRQHFVLLVLNYELTPSVSNLRDIKGKQQSHIISLYSHKAFIETNEKEMSTIPNTVESESPETDVVFNHLNSKVGLIGIEHV